MDALAEFEEMRSKSDGEKLARISELYAAYQTAIGIWEMADHEENIAFGLAQLKGMDKRTKIYKEYKRLESVRIQAGYACDIAKSKIMDYLSIIC
jgi:hypothetical protein